jgi:prevent-host-death family protein
MARSRGKEELRHVPLSELKDDLSRYLREASAERPIVVTRHGSPAGILIGFTSDEEWFDYRLENDPGVLRRVRRAREDVAAGRGVRLQDLEE